MGKVFTIILILLTSTVRSQCNLGAGMGFDFITGFKSEPPYANKDLNLDFSYSASHVILDLRQGFRYMEDFEVYRFNTYFLVGYTTQRQKFFVYDIAIGTAYSLVTNNDKVTYPKYEFVRQICPTLKTSFNFRISEKNRLYLGVDCLISRYSYYWGSDIHGYDLLTRGTTGSLLFSLNYLLKNRADKTKHAVGADKD